MIRQIAQAAKDSYNEVTWELDFNTQVLIRYGAGQKMIVAIRGTEKDIGDIRTDLDFTWADMDLYLSCAMAHHGFFQAAKAVVDKIYQEAYHSGNSLECDIILTGHSLGGVKAVTFGSPRPGDKALKKWIKKDGLQVTRFVNAMDAVTAMPFWIWGYRHIGQLVYLTEDGTYPEPKWWHRIWLRLRARKGILRAHSMDLYLERIKNEL